VDQASSGSTTGKSFKRVKQDMLKAFRGCEEIGLNAFLRVLSKNRGTPKWMLYDGKPY